VVAGTILLVLNTEVGSRPIVRYATGHVKPLVVGKIEGTLMGGLTLYNVSYPGQGYRVDIDQMAFDWQVSRLLAGTLNICNLKATGVDVIASEVKPESSGPSGKPPFSPPVPVVLNDARLQTVRFISGNTNLTLDQVGLNVRTGGSGVRCEALWAKAVGFRIDGRGDYLPQRNAPFHGTVAWRGTLPNDVYTEGKCDIAGDLFDSEIELNLSEPIALMTRGRLHINRELNRALVTGPNVDRASELRAAEGRSVSAGNSPVQNGRRLDVRKLETEVLDGRAVVDGTLFSTPRPHGRLMIHAENVNPGIRWADWPGNLSGVMSVEATIEDRRPNIVLKAIDLAGTLLDQPVEIKGGLAARGKKAESLDLDVVSGKNIFKIDKSSDPQYDFTIEMDAKDPIELWPHLKGRIQAKGHLGDLDTNPVAQVEFTGRNLSYYGFTADKVAGNLDYGPDGKGESTVEITDFQISGDTPKDITADVSGDLQGHTLRFELTSPLADSRIGLAGKSEKGFWNGRIDTARFKLNEDGRWQLMKPVHVMVRYCQIKPFTVCWQKAAETACVTCSFSESKEGWTQTGDVEAPPYRYFAGLIKSIFETYAKPKQ